MEIIKEKTIFQGKYLRFKKKYFKDRNGKVRIWEYAEKINSNFVVIFALTKNKEVILEKIYRVPLEKYLIELPAGLCDKKDEKKIKTAERELLEETGYKSKKISFICKGNVNPGTTTDEASFYFFKDAKFVKKPLTEPAEEIEAIKVPLNKLVDFVLNPPKNTQVDIKILTILPILEKKKLI